MNARALWLILVVAAPALALPSGKVVRTLHLLDASDSYLGLVAAPEASPEADAPSLVGTLKLSQGLPLPAPSPLDDGGGAGTVRSDLTPVLALLVSLIVGFGLGHLVIRDRDSFVLWLIVDIVICVASGVLHAVTPFWFLGFYGIGSLLLLVSHIIQALDVYPKAGGGQLVERARDRTILVSRAGQANPLWSGGGVRLLAASF